MPLSYVNFEEGFQFKSKPLAIVPGSLQNTGVLFTASPEWSYRAKSYQEERLMLSWALPFCCWFQRKSQNHRMFRVGRDLCGSSSPTTLPKQGHLQQAAQDLVREGLEYLHRSRLLNLPGQPVPVLCHPQSEEDLSHVQLELPLLRFVPFAAPAQSAWEQKSHW